MAVLLPINPDHPEPRKIKRVVEILEKGGVIAYPTDTVYGLGCDLMNKQAIESLYQIKGMQRDKNLAFICPDLADIAKYAMDLQGFGAVVNDPALAEGNARFQAMLLRSPAVRIEGGTDQILRNIIAERVLGLPEDMRADKGLPFNRIPTGN